MILVKNSLLNKIIDIKKQFKSSVDNQVGLITDVLDGDSENYSYPGIAMSDNTVLDINVSTVGTVKQMVLHRMYKDNVAPETITIEADSEGEFNLDEQLFTAQALTLTDVLKDVQETMNFNSLIVQSSSLFETTHKASVDMLFKYIDASTDSASSSSQQFKQIIAANCPNGEISQYKFLSILKAIMDQGKKDLSNGSLTMDSSSAYFVANAVCTILKSIVTTVLQAIGTILTIVGGIILKIVGVIFSLISMLVNNIQEQVHTQIQVKDPESSTNFFDGVCCAVSGESTTAVLETCFDGLLLNNARRIDFGPVTYYVWGQSVPLQSQLATRGINANGFFSPDLHPERTIQWLISADGPINIDNTGNFAYVGFQKKSMFKFPDECYYTTEELLSLPYAGDDALILASTFMFGALGLLCASTSGQLDRYDITTNYAMNHFGQCDPSIGDCMYECLCTGIAMIAYYVNDGNLDGWVNMIRTYAGERCTDAAIAINTMNTTRFNLTSGTPGWYRGNHGVHATYSYLTDDDTPRQRVVYLSPLALVWAEPTEPYGDDPVNLYANVSLAYLQDAEDCSYIPEDRTFSFATARWSTVVSVLAVATVVIAATITVAAVGRAQFKKWSVKQQSVQWDKLQRVRSQYIDSDTGQVIGGSQEFNAYWKQIKKYNRVGRFLGYGYYDPVNNWNNAFEIGAPDVSSGDSTGVINSTLADITDDGQINLSSLKTDLQGSGDATLNDIKRLITG